MNNKNYKRTKDMNNAEKLGAGLGAAFGTIAVKCLSKYDETLMWRMKEDGYSDEEIEHYFRTGKTYAEERAEEQARQEKRKQWFEENGITRREDGMIVLEGKHTRKPEKKQGFFSKLFGKKQLLKIETFIYYNVHIYYHGQEGKKPPSPKTNKLKEKIKMNNKNNKNQFCTECGTKLNGGNYCPNCGEKINNGKDYKNILKWIILGASIIMVLLIFAGIGGGNNNPTHAYQDNIDNMVHYKIPAGYKHIETKNVAIGGQVLKTAIYKNKEGKEITVSKMSEGEMYIMGHGKKVPTDNTIKNPDGSVGVLKQDGDFYMLITAENPNVLKSMNIY